MNIPVIAGLSGSGETLGYSPWESPYVQEYHCWAPMLTVRRCQKQEKRLSNRGYSLGIWATPSTWGSVTGRGCAHYRHSWSVLRTEGSSVVDVVHIVAHRKAQGRASQTLTLKNSNVDVGNTVTR